jgi:hypothetical protein
MRDWLRDLFRDRPIWINALMIFSSYMAFIYMPWDIFWKPVAEDKEVWFGIMFSGWWAKLTAIPHWFVYAAAVHGFRRHRSWICTWGALYTAQISLGMLIWNIGYFGFSLTGSLGLLARCRSRSWRWRSPTRVITLPTPVNQCARVMASGQW